MQTFRKQSLRILQVGFDRPAVLTAVRARSQRSHLDTEPPVHTDEWGVFPGEWEGLIGSVNISLQLDGIRLSNSAFHNARLQILLTRLGVKSTSPVESIDVKFPALDGPEYKLLEAGDSISHEDFQSLLSQVRRGFSGELVNVLAEDSVVGSHQQHQLGVRVITDDPATVLIARSLFFPALPREVNAYARSKGWNLAEEFSDENKHWNGREYITSTDAKPGQRPIVVFHGNADKTAIQFIEFNNEIVGANIVYGKSQPVAALQSAVGYAASIILNEGQALSLPSTSFVKGKSSVVVINASEEVIQTAVAAGAEVYGRHFNVITEDSLSTLFRGSIGSKPSSFTQNKYYGVPAVTVGSKSTLLHVPDNQTYPTNRIIILDSSATSTTLTPEDALKAVLDHAESNNEQFVRTLLAKIEVHRINNAKEITKFLQ